MKNIKNEIKELEIRNKKLLELIKSVEKDIKKLPNGNLRICKKGNGCQYFHITKKNDKKGAYIKSNNISFAKKLATKSYEEKLLKQMIKEQKAIANLLKVVEKTTTEDVYNTLNEYRKELVEPIFLSDYDYGLNWQNEEEVNHLFEEGRIYETKKGEKVRSKSEAMIADMYYEMGVPYKYESMLRLKDGKVKYPDFAILKFPERKVIYHEHLGLLEDDEYRKNNLIKLLEYEKNGIFFGKNLIITFETDYAPINIKEMQKMIKELLEL